MEKWRRILKAAFGVGLILGGFLIVLYKNAWRESHRGGFPLWSIETLQALVPFWIIAGVILTAYALYYARVLFRARRWSNIRKR